MFFMINEWIKVDEFGEKPQEKEFLLSDEFGNVYVGSTSFDYYDAEYWFPMPKYPMNDPTDTYDDWLNFLLK